MEAVCVERISVLMVCRGELGVEDESGVKEEGE